MSTQSRIKNVLKPVNDLVLINAETTGAILLRQNAFFGDLVESSVQQIKTLTQAESLRDAVDAQRAYIKEVGSKVSSVTRDNIETLREGGKSAGSVLSSALRRGREEVSEAVDSAQTQVNESVNRARAEVAETVAPEQSAPQFPNNNF